MADETPDPRELDVGPLHGATQVRLSTAALRGVELLADQRQCSKSAVIRSAVHELLEKFENDDGLTLLEEMARQVDAEQRAVEEVSRGMARAEGRRRRSA